VLSVSGVNSIGAKEARIVYFPGDDLELLDVFEENARRIVAGIAPWPACPGANVGCEIG
jgi:hypothetical protein